MITIVAKLKVKAGSEAAFVAEMQTMIEHVKANEPGTLTYVLYRATGDPTEFVVYENYVDQAAMAAHSGSEAMMKFFGTAGALLEGRPEIGIYEEVGGKK